MSTINAGTSVADAVHTPFLWERQARPVLASITAGDGEPVRGAVVGNAGSGKSSILRELHRLLAEQGTEARIFDGSIGALQLPREHVLLVDDLHLLDATSFDHLRSRSEDPDASLLVATRPWPRADGVARITRALERSRPAIVLGHVSRSDVLTYLGAGDQVVSSTCVDHLLEITGGVSWLVTESLAVHDTRDCVDDPTHRAVRQAIEDRVAHRLDSIPTDLRHEIEALYVAPGSRARALSERDEVLAHGYAEGLLARNGTPVPLVRSAVRASIPVARLIELSHDLAGELVRAGVSGDHEYRSWIGGVRDAGISAALIEHADRLSDREPARAIELYDSAVECGAPPADLSGRRAQAAWALGDLRLAGSIIDEHPPGAGTVDADLIADTSAAIWSARAMLATGDAVYRAQEPTSCASIARATIAAIGSGRLATRAECTPASGLPTTLGVALDLVDRGLRASLRPDATESAIADLVRASEMYTASASAAPVSELPAVLAAIVAMNTGDLDIAHTVIEEAIAGCQGGEWARPRLLLWRAWLALQRSRPHAAREALAQAVASSSRPSPRDIFLAQAIRVAISRRYEDAASLTALWAQVRDSGLHIEVDLYLLQPLCELLTAAARVGDTTRLQSHFSHALEIVEQLGSPSLWSSHLEWTGIQQGILLNRPDDLKPHARALLQAAAHNPIAAVMARAGRVWTACLAGTVDADAVEAAAHGLASAGLRWDGARLAGHGASRSTDRKISARLLSCARELHPPEATREAPHRVDADQQPIAQATDGLALSERERDVARLVLQGKTYAEIGGTIFISPRTAEHHIAHIRRRLGATSRSDLIAKLRVVVGQSVDSGGSASPDTGNGTLPPS